jgi:hypothetical protein
MKQRQAVTKVTAKRYEQASKKEKKQMLDEFCRTTGYISSRFLYEATDQLSSTFLREATGKGHSANGGA